MSTALVEPHVRPSGNLKWFSIVVKGLGASLTGAIVGCAAAMPAVALIATAIVSPRHM
jgi:hypothetical protein